MKLVRVPLRISLAGGGSDIPSHYEKRGGAVVSFTIDKYIYITAKPNISLFPHKYRLVYSQVEECNDRNEIKHPIIRQLVDDYGLGSLDLDVMSDVPAGTGLGSSSAFTVGLHHALCPYSELKDHTAAYMACQTELTDLRELIGKQDQYAAAFGGINYFHFTKHRVEVSPVLFEDADSSDLLSAMHLIYIGGNRRASALLETQQQLDNTKHLMGMHALANEAWLCLRGGFISEIGHIIRDGWELKKKLSPSISTPLVDQIIDTALQHGATGGKLLGAGGAGFVLLFCPYDRKQSMLDGLKPLGLQYIPFNFDFGGAKVLYAD